MFQGLQNLSHLPPWECLLLGASVPWGVWRGLEPGPSPGKMAESLKTPHSAPCLGTDEEAAAVLAPVTPLVWK